MEMEGRVVIDNSAKVKIEGSKIESGEGVVKRGTEVTKIEGSKVVSKETGIRIEEGIIEVEGSKVEGEEGIEIGEKGELKQEGLEIKSKETGLIYKGEGKEEIKGIVIKSEGAAIISEGKEIKIEGSKIEGEIGVEGIGEIEVRESEVGGIGVRNKGQIIIKNSKIRGEEIRGEGDGELVLKNTNIDLSNQFSISENSKVNIDNVSLKSDNYGIVNYGHENLILKYSSLQSTNNALKVLNKSNAIFLDNVNLSSISNYSLNMVNSYLFANNLKCNGNQGISCIDSYLDIINLDVNIFANSFKLSNSKIIIKNFKINSKFYQNNIAVSGISKIVLDNGEFDFSNAINFNNIPVFVVSDQSVLNMSNIILRSEKNLDSTIFMLKERTSANLNNVIVKNFAKLSENYMNSYISVTDSDILTANDSIVLHGNSVADIYNTKIDSSMFKFVINDFSNLGVENSYIKNGALCSADKFSEIYSYKLSINADKVVNLSDYSVMSDNESKWDIKNYDIDNKKSVCYLMNGTKLNINKSDIDTNIQLLFAINSSGISIENSSIKSSTKFPLIDLRYFSKLYMINTTADSSHMFQLKDMADLNVSKSNFNVKNLFSYSLDDVKILISDSIIKTKEKFKTAIKLLYNSKLNINSSKIIGFNNAIEYDTINNINIEKTKFDCKNKFIKTSFESKSLIMNLIQKFVLISRKFSVFNFLYKLIYLIAIKFYILSSDKRYVNLIYLRRGMLNDWIPGSSDIDFLTVIKDTTDFKNIYGINKKYRFIKKIFPFYGENLIMTNEELNFYMLNGGIRSKNLLEAKKLYGKKNIENKKTNLNFIKTKIDIVSEILNSYILFSNNYFFNDSITNDICFSKATIDILKNINYFYTDNKPCNSRTDFINTYLENCNVLEKDYLNNILEVLLNNKNFTKETKDEIFNIVFAKLDKLSEDFINLLKAKTDLSVISKDFRNVEHSLFGIKLAKLDVSKIKSILFEDPGLCCVVFESNTGMRFSDLSLYYNKQIKDISIVHNTPILFFTKDMFQMALLSKFQDTPLNILKLNNLKSKYKNRIFYLKDNMQYYYHKKEVLKMLILESVSEQSFKLNDIMILKKFSQIDKELYSVLIQMLEFYLYMKNDKITKIEDSENVVLKYSSVSQTNKQEINDVLMCFSEENSLSDYDKKVKILTFVKKLKDSIIENYE